MADKILNATREDNADTSVKCYHVSYEVEDAGDKNQFVVVVLAEDMTDDTDEAEAKTLANAKASTIKADWVTLKANDSTNTDEPTLEGDVTL